MCESNTFRTKSEVPRWTHAVSVRIAAFVFDWDRHGHAQPKARTRQWIDAAFPGPGPNCHQVPMPPFQLTLDIQNSVISLLKPRPLAVRP